jgi:hypothetical protein
MSGCECVYLEPIALIGHDAVLTRGQRTTNEGRCSTHSMTKLLTRVRNDEVIDKGK